MGGVKTGSLWMGQVGVSWGGQVWPATAALYCRPSAKAAADAMQSRRRRANGMATSAVTSAPAPLTLTLTRLLPGACRGG